MIVDIRIDDRLVHGQVLQGWVPKLGVNTIIVVCNSELRRTELDAIYGLTMPASLKVIVVSTDHLLETMDLARQGEERVMILAGDLESLAAIPADHLVPRITLGNLCNSPNTFEEKQQDLGHCEDVHTVAQLSKSFGCTGSQMRQISELLSRGVRIVACAGVHDSAKEITEVSC